MKTLTSLCLALSLTMALPALANCARPANIEARVAQTMSEINAYRKSGGLPALSTDRRLAKAAANHACDMAAMGKYSHVGSNGSDLARRIKAQGYRFRTANENVGQFRATTSAAGWWYTSAGHRANILSPQINEVGLGVAIGADQKLYWVMVGGRSR